MKLGRMNKRQVILAAALLLTLAATAYVWVSDRKAAMVLTVEAAEPTIRPQLDVRPESAPTLPARNLPEAASDIFAVKKEPEPEPKKVVVSPPALPPPPPITLPPQQTLPPPPAAPPLPFTYLGKLGEDGKFTVFLSVRGRSFAVKTGDTVAQVYRVDEIRPPIMALTYIPMNIKQTMQIGETN